jgi:hypothetical protein
MPFARSFLQAASRPDLSASRGIALTDLEERGPTGCRPGRPGGSHHPAGPHAGCCAPVTTPPRTSGHVPPAPRAATAQGSAGRDWCLWSAVGSGSATWLLAGSEEPLSRGGGTSDPARPSWVTYDFADDQLECRHDDQGFICPGSAGQTPGHVQARRRYRGRRGGKCARRGGGRGRVAGIDASQHRGVEHAHLRDKSEIE